MGHCWNHTFTKIIIYFIWYLWFMSPKCPINNAEAECTPSDLTTSIVVSWALIKKWRFFVVWENVSVWAINKNNNFKSNGIIWKLDATINNGYLLSACKRCTWSHCRRQSSIFRLHPGTRKVCRCLVHLPPSWLSSGASCRYIWNNRQSGSQNESNAFICTLYILNLLRHSSR